MKKKTSLYGFRGCIPEILRYQVITKFWIAILAWLLRLARGAVLWTSGRSAVSSGDIPFIMTSVQGWITIILGLALLVIYMVFDINAMVLVSERVLHNQPIRVREIVKEAFSSLRHFRHPLSKVFMGPERRLVYGQLTARLACCGFMQEM